MFDHPYATCVAILEGLPMHEAAFRSDPHRRRNGAWYYAEARTVLENSTFHPTPETVMMRAAVQYVVFRVREARPLADHIAALKHLGLRPALYWEAVYLDGGGLYEQSLYESLLVLGETVQTVTRDHVAPMRFPVITKKVPGVEFVDCATIQSEVPLGMCILAILEVSAPMQF